jgi:GST-like protein
MYLASKTGRFLPKSIPDRYKTLQWLMFQMGGLGPMLGQNHHFRLYAPEKIPYAIERYTNEANRLYRVLDTQLRNNRFIAGKHYTIADIAIFPWTRNWEKQGVDISALVHFQRWFTEISARPAVQRGVSVLAALRPASYDAKAKDILFGQKQYRR